MAGINIEIDDAELNRALSEVEKLGDNLDGLFSQMGEYLLRKTRDRFADEQAPDGTPWAQLSQATTLTEGYPFSKTRNRDKVLTESGALMGTLRFAIEGNSLVIGSNRPYAAMMHFGGKTSPNSMIPNATIPARPFLGVNSQEKDHLLKLAKRYVEQIINNA